MIRKRGGGGKEHRKGKAVEAEREESRKNQWEGQENLDRQTDLYQSFPCITVCFLAVSAVSGNLAVVKCRKEKRIREKEGWVSERRVKVVKE